MGDISDILKNTGCNFEKNKDVTHLSSIRIPAVARTVAYPDSAESLVSVIETLNKNAIPYKVVGGISNILIKNGFYEGVLIKTTKIRGKSTAENSVTVSCGEYLSKIILSLAQNDLGGLEGLSGIPGTVGGMVRQNAGAYGCEIADPFIDALCYFPSTREVKRTTRSDMDFSYRHSALMLNGGILLSATFELVPRRRDDVLFLINEYRSKRLASQPCELPSLGSVFKRHLGVSAGYYIDKAGLKGYFLGGARVSEKHAGFIVNAGGATADDFLRLVEYIKRTVYAAFQIELTEEIEII